MQDLDDREVTSQINHNHHPRDQFRSIEPSSPVRGPRPELVLPHIQVLTEKNKENLPGPLLLRSTGSSRESAST
jgi:hypothetical protein